MAHRPWLSLPSLRKAKGIALARHLSAQLTHPPPFLPLRAHPRVQLPVIVEPEDGGAIIVDSVEAASVQLRLKPEHCLEAAGTFKQWFYFEARNLAVGPGTSCAFAITDASV